MNLPGNNLKEQNDNPESSIYINRELSWLDFNFRVLGEATSEDNPLLERLKFLAITASNLDEFFKVRVGGLTILNQSSPGSLDIADLTPAGQLNAIRDKVRRLYEIQYSCLLEQLEPALEGAGIYRQKTSELSRSQIEFLESRFEDEIFAVISPIKLDDSKSFPLLAGAQLSVCVRLEPDAERSLAFQSDTRKTDDEESSDDEFAVIAIGHVLSRFMTLPADSGYHYVGIESVISHFVHQFFPGRNVKECVSFRVTRNADIKLDEDDVSDMLSGMTQMLIARTNSNCVRLEVESGISDKTKAFLMKALDVSDHDIFECKGPIDLSAFMSLSQLPGFEHLRNKDWPSLDSPQFPSGADIFEIISAKDRLLIHPYESFDPVVDLICSAAEDPDVIAIKQILYRTSKNSAVVEALAEAASNGKNVTVIVELKARFDEERNIKWAQQLEQAGVDVIYGVRGLKTHGKICVVVRREPSGIKRYVHFGTGNYNEATARIYSDISYLTCDQQLGDDAVKVFNAITGMSVPQSTRKLAFSPVDLRSTIEEMIDTEIRNAEAGLPAKIDAKFNSLTDKDLIDRLYEASQAGVKIRLNIRGICCLRPGIEGLSDNIQVISIVDRFLEHARIFCFHHDGMHRTFIASADWMTRNLDRRVELLIPVENPEIKSRLLKTLNSYFQDNIKAHQLLADGNYARKTPEGKTPYRAQEELYLATKELHSAQSHYQTTLFQSHRGDRNK